MERRQEERIKKIVQNNAIEHLQVGLNPTRSRPNIPEKQQHDERFFGSLVGGTFARLGWVGFKKPSQKHNNHESNNKSQIVVAKR